MLQGPRAAAAAANGGHRWSPMSPAWTRSPSPGCRWTPLASRYWNAVVGLRASRAPCRRLRSAMDKNQSGFRTSGGARATVAAWRGAQSGWSMGKRGARCTARRCSMDSFSHTSRATQTLEFLVTGASVGSLHPVLCLGARGGGGSHSGLRVWFAGCMSRSACDPVPRMDTVPTLPIDDQI